MWIQCLITVLRQFFKSICTTKHSDGKRICCALITDYYKPMNKHLSCQHLQYELLSHDCDPIWISPHAVLHVKKSLAPALRVKCERGCSQVVPLAAAFDGHLLKNEILVRIEPAAAPPSRLHRGEPLSLSRLFWTQNKKILTKNFLYNFVSSVSYFKRHNSSPLSL